MFFSIFLLRSGLTTHPNKVEGGVLERTEGPGLVFLELGGFWLVLRGSGGLKGCFKPHKRSILACVVSVEREAVSLSEVVAVGDGAASKRANKALDAGSGLLTESLCKRGEAVIHQHIENQLQAAEHVAKGLPNGLYQSREDWQDHQQCAEEEDRAGEAGQTKGGDRAPDVLGKAP